MAARGAARRHCLAGRARRASIFEGFRRKQFSLGELKQQKLGQMATEDEQAKGIKKVREGVDRTGKIESRRYAAQVRLMHG